MGWVQFRSVSGGYPGASPLLNKFDLSIGCEVGEGKIIALMGNSAVGKSTLLRLLADADTRSTVITDGEIVFSENTKLAYVPQSPVFVETLNSERNISLFDHVRAIRDDLDVDMRSKFVNALEVDRFPKKQAVSSLSGGQRQRVMLARTLGLAPNLLLLDEPAAALDPGARGSFLFQLREIICQRAILAIYVTHNLEEAREFCNEIVFLKREVDQPLSGSQVPLPIDKFMNFPPNLQAAVFVKSPYFVTMPRVEAMSIGLEISSDTETVGIDGRLVTCGCSVGLKCRVIFATSQTVGLSGTEGVSFRILVPRNNLLDSSHDQLAVGNYLTLDCSRAVFRYGSSGQAID